VLIARHWYGYAVTGHSATVERWLESLPQEMITHDAPLALVKAWLCALGGWREECEEFLTLAESIPHEGPLPDGTASVESGVATIRAVFGFGGIKDMVEAARRADALGLDRTSPQAPLVKLGLGFSWYFSGHIVQARRALEGGLRLTDGGHPIARIGMLSCLSFVAGDEGHPEVAESLARETRALVDRFRLQGIPQATLASITLGRALAGLGKLEEAQLERAYSARRRLPGLSPWPTIIGLLAFARVRSARGDRAGSRTLLDEVRAILEDISDAGILPELLERQEKKLRARKPREGQLDVELTQRELNVLRLLGGELSTRQMAESLYVAPSTVRTQVKSIYRKLGVSSRKEAVGRHTPEASSSLYRKPVNPLGDVCGWRETDYPAVDYAQETPWGAEKTGQAGTRLHWRQDESTPEAVGGLKGGSMENPFSYFHIGNLLVIDLIAAGTNALNGALLARNPSHYRGNYWTIIGILSLSVFGGIGGGVVRDVMLAQVPAALSNPWYIFVCLVAGAVGMTLAYNRGQQFRARSFQLLTAFSLPWYAAVGVQKGLDAQLPMLGAIFLGMVGSTAGRYFIDITSSQPAKQFLRGEWFVTTAALTSVVYLICACFLGFSIWPATLISFVFGFAFRVTAVWRGWEEPTPKMPPDLMEGVPEHEKDREATER